MNMRNPGKVVRRFAGALMLGLILLMAGGAVYAAQAETASTMQAGSSEPLKKNGLKKVGSDWYYYRNGKKVTGTWMTVSGRKYYFRKNGKAVKGNCKIGGVWYIFNSKGQLANIGKPVIVREQGRLYMADGKGHPLKGWQIYKGKLYYVHNTGRIMTSKTTKSGITLGANGQAKNNAATGLKIKTMKIVSSITQPGWSKSQKLRACWNYVVGGHIHYSPYYPNLNSRGWQKRLAYRTLNQGAGNCYGFACAFAALAAEVGYRPYVLCGRCPGTTDGAADGYTRHAWVLIGGLHYDPEATYEGWAPGIYGSAQGAGYVQQQVDFMYSW